MHPILIKIFGLPVFSYGFFLACGFLFATITAAEIGKRYSLSKDTLLDFAVWLVISGVVGARIFYILLNLPFYIAHPLEVIMLNKGGLVFYGGLIASTITALIFIRKYHLPLWKTGDILLTVTPVGQMFGRIGCFMNGCCFGTPTTHPFRVIFPMNSPPFDFYQEFQPVHPVQLYESFGAGMIFLILVTVIEKKRFDGQIMALYCIFYPILRFCVEFFRADNPKYGLFSISQYISIGIFLMGVALYAYLSIRNAREELKIENTK